MNRTCNESSEEQNGAGRHQVAADDESREKESVDETALVVDGSAVEGFPEAQVVAEVLRHEVCKPKFAYNSLRIIISALPARPCIAHLFLKGCETPASGRFLPPREIHTTFYNYN